MSVDYSTTALVANIKRKVQIPSGDTKFTDAELLAIADDEMRSYVIPALLRAHEDYLVEQATVAYTASQSRVLLPTPCTASRIMSISLVRANGTAYDLHRVPPSAIDQYANQTGLTPTNYCVQGDYLYLLPTPTDTTSTLRIRFERLSPRFVLQTSTNAGTILTALTASTFQTPPATGVLNFTAGEYLSCWNARPPFGSPWGYYLFTSYAANTLTMSGSPLYGSTDDTRLDTGTASYPDVVMRWNETAYPQLPENWHPVLLYAASSTVAREYGDATYADYLRAEVDRRIEVMIETATGRVQYEAPVIFNRGSMMRTGYSSYRGRS